MADWLLAVLAVLITEALAACAIYGLARYARNLDGEGDAPAQGSFPKRGDR